MKDVTTLLREARAYVAGYAQAPGCATAANELLLEIDGALASSSETSTPASDAAQRILQLTKALEQSVRVVRVWHAMPQKPNDADAFDLYFNHSPEMKLIRDALGKMPEWEPGVLRRMGTGLESNNTGAASGD